jgi:LEA14-like dessication related protein
MKNYLIAAGVVAAAYFGYTLYQKKQSIDAVTFDIVDVDLAAMKIAILFNNIGNSNLNVTAVRNEIYVDGNMVGEANKMSAFTINKQSDSKVVFDFKPSISGGLSYLLGLLKGVVKPAIRIETTINANGLLFTKTTNI